MAACPRPAPGTPYGIPVTVVDGTHPKVGGRVDDASESDRVGYPRNSGAVRAP